MDYKRSDRVADVIQQEIADLLLRRVKDPRVANVMVSGIKVSDDLQHATVYFYVTGMPDDAAKESAKEGLNKAKGFMRSELVKRLRLRYVPQLDFRYDTSFEYSDKIERLLKEIHRND